MKNITTQFISTLVLPFTLLIPVTSVCGDNDAAAVTAIAEAYIKATYEGDAETMKKLFHKSAVMNGYLRGRPGMGGPDPFIHDLANNPSLKSGNAPYKATIDYIHVSGKIGSVTISETGFGDMNFTNYFHLMKDNGEWKIVSKTFMSH